MIVVSGTVTARPETLDQMLEAALEHVRRSRAEPGCLQYHMLRDAEDPTLFIFFEVWASREHLALHSGLPHMRDFHTRRMEYLRRDFEIREIEMLGA